MIHKLCRAEDIADNSWKVFTVNNFVEIMVGFRNGKLFAINNTCPHRGAPLSKGDFNEDNIVCHRHFYEYNLFTGKLEKIASRKKEDKWIEQSPAWRFSDNLTIYPVFIKDGFVYVEAN
jgi:nitrite reductase/ring-hydroxylating ferredoxin subunit